MRLRFYSAALIVALAAAVFATSAQAQVREYLLDNGLKVVVKQDTRAPVVVSQVWYKVGSSYEHGGITGVSHVLEHMMFKGTERYPNGEFSRIIAENGGRENAFTSRDYTGYYQQLERSRLPVSLELEADRMRNLVLPEDEFVKELAVVMEERRLRTEDNPQALTYERFKAASFFSHPYGYPVIGWMDDLEHMTVRDLRTWYDRWYAPNNATLVVVGDVNPDAVHALAKRYFGPLEAREVPPLKPRREVEQRGERRIAVKAPAELPYLLMGFKAPVLNTVDEPWEAYALQVAAGVLDGGRTARFARYLVRGSEIAASAGAGYSLYSRDADQFLISGTPSEGRSVEELEAAILEQIRRLREEPVSAEELARIKAQVVASDIYQNDSLQSQAMRIGVLETAGLGWRVMDEYVERIQAVTPEQIMAVARKYLVPDRMTVAVLDPQPVAPGRRPPAADPHAGEGVH